MSAEPSTSVGEIRQRCDRQQPGTLHLNNHSLQYQFKLTKLSDFFWHHKANYLLSLTYSSNPRGGTLDGRDDELDNVEIKYLFSIKVPIVTDISVFDADIFSYTQLSLWQAYNSEVS